MAVLVRRTAPPARAQQAWDPSRELEELQSRMQQLVEGTLPGLTEAAAWTPPVDIEETEDAWIVEAELPGVDRKDIDIEMNDGEVAITGEIKERERKGILRRRTRRVGRFEFRVTLPGDIDAEQVEANVDGGVLTVRIPKPERSRPHRVEIGSSTSNGGG
jgi:HSP20 family protein